MIRTKQLILVSPCSPVYDFLQLKTKMQVQILQQHNSHKTGQYRHVFEAASSIVRQHGLLALYQGLPATWLRNVPAFSVYFGEHAQCTES